MRPRLHLRQPQFRESASVKKRALRILLGATNASTWALSRKTRTGHLFPKSPSPAERAFFEQLNDDPAVSASHQHYVFWLDQENTRKTEWITAGLLDNSLGWKKIKAWTLSPSAKNAVFSDCDYGYFNGQWRLSPTQPVYRLEQTGSAAEASAFGSVELGKVWSGGDTYGKPMLEVLDAIKDSSDGSPVFRAYLFCSLVELMEFQPDGWGLSFCPSARVLFNNPESQIQTPWAPCSALHL